MSSVNGKNVCILQELKGHTSDVTCVEFWGNALLISGSSDKTVRIWKWTIGSGFVEEAISPLLGHTYGVTSVKMSPQGGVLASSSKDGTTILWNMTNGEKTDVLYQDNGEAVRCLCFSPNAIYMATADDSGAICVWGPEKTLIKKYRYHDETIYTINFSPDSNILLTGCNIGQIRIAVVDKETDDSDLEPEYDCAIDNAHDLGVTSSDFVRTVYTDPLNSETIIYTAVTAGTDQLIKVWRIFFLKTGSTTSETNRLVPGKFDHESGLSTVYATKLMNAECVQMIKCHSSSVTCVRLNLCGNMIATASLDKTVKLWSNQGKVLATLARHKRYVNCVVFNEASNILASGSNDRDIIIWDLSASLTLDSRFLGLGSMVFNMAFNKMEAIPSELKCPLTNEIMSNPILLDDGFNYDRSAIMEWFDAGQRRSPITNEPLKSMDLVDNFVLKAKIDKFLKFMDFEGFDV